MSSNPIFDESQMLTLAQANQDLSLTIVDHPLVRTALAVIRDKDTTQVEFRTAVHMLTPHLIYAATRDLTEENVAIKTPLAPMTARRVKDQIVLIPILRSGIGMHEPTQKIFPHAPTIFAGMARDEATAIPHWYYDLKQLEYLNRGMGVVFLVLDPMLATGGSAIETVKRIKDIYPKGVIKMISMIAAPEGVKALNLSYADVAITVAAVDDHLNEKYYIVPGLGDAGDRQFGTILVFLWFLTHPAIFSYTKFPGGNMHLGIPNHKKTARKNPQGFFFYVR
jgi:uracil phosphoribosyltransferase